MKTTLNDTNTDQDNIVNSAKKLKDLGIEDKLIDAYAAKIGI